MEKTVFQAKYGSVKRSTLRNQQFSMLAFGLVVGLVFPFFARIVLKAPTALSTQFFAMCVAAGLLVGFFNYHIFRVNVSRELMRVQQGMNHVNENIGTANVLEDGCQNSCLLEITSADIIGDIEVSFNSMSEEIFKRLEGVKKIKLYAGWQFHHRLAVNIPHTCQILAYLSWELH